MNQLSVDNLGKSFADKLLFKEITFGLSKGEKVALVGINGVGKSTLLHILMGIESADSGQFNFSKSINVGFLPQTPSVDDHTLIMDYVLDGNDEVMQTVKSYYQALELGEHKQIDSALLDKMTALNAWDFESRAQQILGKLGITKISQTVNTLSGGQKKRVALARLLLQNPDVMLLDEPTNHLDLGAIEWLEEYLKKLKITLLLVTHDRYFLQAVTNTILELESGTIYRYKCNYTQYLEKRLERHTLQQEQVDKAKNLLRKELDWLSRQPKARTSKAKYRIDAVDELKKEASKTFLIDSLNIKFTGKRLGKKILEVNQLTKRFDEQQVINNFNYTFKAGDKIGLIGDNGVGKSTFLNLITGMLAPDAGTISKGETVVFGYYRQSGMNFNQHHRVIDSIKEVAEVITLKDNQEVTASQLLTMFHFNPKKQYDYIKNLSGGEKRRLQLLKVLMSNPNFLILDEPTNDLDLETLNTLESYLEKFSGCLLIVSHDRYFMDKLVEQIFYFSGVGQIKSFPGNYTDFRTAELQENNSKKGNKPDKSSNHVKKVKNASKKLSFSEKREVAQIEQELEALATEKESVTDQLNQETDFERLANLGSQIKEIEDRINSLEDRWLELNEEI